MRSRGDNKRGAFERAVINNVNAYNDICGANEGAKYRNVNSSGQGYLDFNFAQFDYERAGGNKSRKGGHRRLSGKSGKGLFGDDFDTSITRGYNTGYLVFGGKRSGGGTDKKLREAILNCDAGLTFERIAAFTTVDNNGSTKECEKECEKKERCDSLATVNLQNQCEDDCKKDCKKCIDECDKDYDQWENFEWCVDWCEKNYDK